MEEGPMGWEMGQLAKKRHSIPLYVFHEAEQHPYKKKQFQKAIILCCYGHCPICVFETEAFFVSTFPSLSYLVRHQSAEQ